MRSVGGRMRIGGMKNEDVTKTKVEIVFFYRMRIVNMWRVLRMRE